MRQGEGLEVWMDQKKVGLLALTVDHKVAFSYCDTWLEEGFSISPFSLPLKKQVFVPKKDYFGGLFGVFADSLPDAWGRLLLERLLREQGNDVGDYTMIDRLAIVGTSGMGALTYRPQHELARTQGKMNLDELAEQCQKILLTEYAEKLDELYQLGGTSGGARPKIMTQIDSEDWIIKFPAHNRDDHSKNFSFIYSEKEDKWHLSPAYDLTYSNTYYGEHTTTVDGNGKNPGKRELLAVGMQAGMSRKQCEKIADEIEQCVSVMLKKYL